ncbi:MAG: carbohydrate kinase family protein, partial [Caldilinea sp.]
NYDPTGLWEGGINATLAQVDLFLPNETELTAITRHSSWQSGLASLANRVPTVALKRGSAGASATRNGQTTHAAPLPVQVVDTTGAGDSFDAGFVYAHLAGWPLPQMLQFAVACGSASTRAAGGTHAQPTLADAQTLLTQHGFPPHQIRSVSTHERHKNGMMRCSRQRLWPILPIQPIHHPRHSS